jgi:tRNA(Ile)-lysidine synthase TilS/MesJ
MFSGGRDSTLAAIRLLEDGLRPTLITVTSSHLFGYTAVEARLKELKNILPAETIHMQVAQPRDLRVDQEFYFRTCLPCQHAYVVTAAVVAKHRGAKKIAFGYANYQGDWPEQTLLATGALSRAVADFGLELLLPAYTFEDKELVKERLEHYGLSSQALEQKCSQQVHNIALTPDHLRQQVDGWESAIRASLRQLDDIKLEVFSTRYLGSY